MCEARFSVLTGLDHEEMREETRLKPYTTAVILLDRLFVLSFKMVICYGMSMCCGVVSGW